MGDTKWGNPGQPRATQGNPHQIASKCLFFTYNQGQPTSHSESLTSKEHISGNKNQIISAATLVSCKETQGNPP